MRVGQASDVRVVSSAVAHALTARRPKTRYKVGAGSQTQFVAARLVPDRARDKIVKALLKI